VPLIRTPPALCLPSALTVVLLGTVLLTACDVSIKDGDVSVDVLTAEARDEWSRRFPVPAGGSVEVVNVNGPIDVTVGEAGFAVIEATRIARAMTDPEAKEILSKGTIEETITPSTVKVSTTGIRRPHSSYRVHYRVRVPSTAKVVLSGTSGPVKVTGQVAGLKATVVNGSLDIIDTAGPVDGVVVNGSLSITLVGTLSDTVRGEATNGRLSLEIPRAAKARLSARAVNGPISVEGLPVDNPEGRRLRELEVDLNGGGPEVDLRLTNGRMTIVGR
jgi:hypothetical protein